MLTRNSSQPLHSSFCVPVIVNKGHFVTFEGNLSSKKALGAPFANQVCLSLIVCIINNKQSLLGCVPVWLHITIETSFIGVLPFILYQSKP
jgi:hypothetical protein